MKLYRHILTVHNNYRFRKRDSYMFTCGNGVDHEAFGIIFVCSSGDFLLLYQGRSKRKTIRGGGGSSGLGC